MQHTIATAKTVGALQAVPSVNWPASQPSQSSRMSTSTFTSAPTSTSTTTTTPTTMRAAVIYTAGPASQLKVEDRPVPTPTPGSVLIRVKAFGLNRSELFTRQGMSPNVKFPRILGIECVGIVEECLGGEFERGVTVLTCMGGLGRDFDGGYAAFTLVPAAQVKALSFTTKLSWAQLGALPEMLETAWGSLYRALRLQKGETLLLRGGTTSVGLAAAAIARNYGATVISTTRRADRETLLKSHGATHVLVDDGKVAEKLREIYPKGVNKVLELIGTTTLIDSIACAAEAGIVCMTGMVGNAWSLPDFSPMDSIPTSVCLTCYSGGNEDFLETPYDELVKQVEEGRLEVAVGKTFGLEEIVEAHVCMEENKAGGKIVVVVEE